MTFKKTLLRSTLGARIVILFMVCALVPLLATAVLSFTHVTRQLNEQSRMRLRQESKALSMSLIERLLFLQNELRLIRASAQAGAGVALSRNDPAYVQHLQDRFKGLAFVDGNGRRTPLLHDVQAGSERLTPEHQRHLAADRSLLSVRPSDRGHADVFMRVALDPKNIDAGLLWALLNPDFLWWGNAYDPQTDLVDLLVIDDQARILFCLHEQGPAAHGLIVSDIVRRPPDPFEYQLGSRTCIGIAWPLFLQYEFAAPAWQVVLSTEKANILRPAAEFKFIFSQALLLAFWVVLLLSFVQIRRSLLPLQDLKRGTQDIARQKFDTRVLIASGDEFEDLATSFNAMAAQLGRQFDALTTMGAIDRAILSSLDTRIIIENMVAGSFSLFACAGAGVTLRSQDPAPATRTYYSLDSHGAIRMLEGSQINLDELEELKHKAGAASLWQRRNLPACLWPLLDDSLQLFLVAPLIISEEVAGLVWFCFHDGCMPSPSLIMHAEQIANQVAVALAKARLVFELEQFNRGTLTALARAIDMKSRWTAGHSERVMKIAHKIGTAMHLSQGELDDLYRGGLIHDIGKIGIPTAILDKPGKLTQEEYLRVCEHPRMGARILEPIRAYAGIVTLVVQHHERYDGSGYPDGLKGEQIALSARILAVADVFEALSADRPYRPGMGFQQIIDYMRQQSGKQFDPAVVAALLKTLERLNSRDALLLDEHQEAALLHQEHSQGGP